MRPRLHKKEKMNQVIRFLVTPTLRERLWNLCAEHGLIPSEVIRAGVRKELDRLERERNETTKEKGGENE